LQRYRIDFHSKIAMNGVATDEWWYWIVWMDDDVEKRSPYTPESNDLFGPGVEMWNRPREDNDFQKMLSSRLLNRKKIRADFLTGIKPILDDLVSWCSKNH
jgi:hypothetical protein